MYYSQQDANREIRRRSREGRLRITLHASEQMEHRGIDRQEVERCLARGTVVGCDFDGRHQDWTYRNSLRLSLSSTLIVVVALPDDDPCNVVVTAFLEA